MVDNSTYTTIDRDTLDSISCEQHSLIEVTYMVEEGVHYTLHIVDTPHTEKVTIDLKIIVKSKATFSGLVTILHAREGFIRIALYLEGEESEAYFDSVYGLYQQQKLVIETYQHHKGIRSQSRVLVKGMIKDSAYISYHGLIYIAAGAKRVQADQVHKNIVLDSSARVISRPTIEVLEYDVQCSHGSALGTFDAQHLWYLYTKGITGHVAQFLLIHSFFADALKSYEHKSLVMDAVCKKMI